MGYLRHRRRVGRVAGMTATVGVALVGAGPWGLTLGRAATRLPEVDLRWICDLERRRLEAAATLTPTARLTATLDEALADPAVQAVLVAVDSPRHHPVGRLVLEADRHVLIEKPLAMSVAHAAELSALAASRHRVLSVGHLLLHHPAVRRARALVAAGAIGAALWLESTRLATTPARSPGGVWWTLAPHDVSLALHFFGAVPTRVAVVAPGVRGEVDAVAWATLHFGDGAVAHIHVATAAPEKRRGFQVVGTEGTLTFDELFAGGELRVLDRRYPGRPGEVVAVEADDALSAQCRHFVAGVARCDPAAGNADHALGVVRVLESGIESMQNGGAPVEVV